MIKIPFFVCFFTFLFIWMIYRRNAIYKSFNIYKEIVFTTFFIYLSVVFYLTFEPFHFYLPDSHEIRLYLVPFEEITAQYYRSPKFAMFYLFGNIIMFVPFGFLLPLLFLKAKKFINILLFSFLFSFAIELFQALFTFRSAEIDDLIFNTLGGILGYLAYLIFIFFTGINKPHKKIMEL